VARLKITAAIYLTLGVLGLAAAVLVPVVIYYSGTSALPIWRSAASPGPLSSAHAFLGEQCETCHTPNQGIKAASCITCHAPDALVLAKQSTAFHATIATCASCHVEHQGAKVRPIKMDHLALVEAGLRAAQAGIGPDQPAATGMAALRRSLAAVTGNEPAKIGEVLDCASCHSFRDKHRALFGQQCAACHATETWKIAGFLHPSPKSQDCNQCHQAPPSHFMMHFAMMDQKIAGQSGARVEQCYLCHQTDSFNNIKGVGWFKIH